MKNLIDFPLFISGHTRSGTNLLMRLLDGSKGLMTPPGVGKLHTLRRFAWRQPSNNEGVYDQVKRISELLELELKSNEFEKFEEHLKRSIGKNQSPSFRGDIEGVLDAIQGYGNFGEKQIKRWVEKNHNLEFYWGRALLSFANPSMVVMLRDPRDVWGSWREECKRNNLDTSKKQMRKNLQQHLFEEMIESSFGVNRFQDFKELQKYYKIPNDKLNRLHEGIAHALIEGINTDYVNSDIIDLDGYDYADNPAGRFAWNYKVIGDRANWLMHKYPQQVTTLSYEKLTHYPDQMVTWMANFAGIEVPESITPTEIGNDWGGNSSFENNFKGVSTDSVGRWKEKLDGQEVEAVEAVAWDAYKQGMEWKEASLKN